MRVQQAQRSLIALDDSKNFVTKQDVAAGNSTVYGYQIKGPEDYVISVEQGTPVAPEFYDSNGDKLDGSTRVVIQKCDRRGNLLGGGLVFSELLSRFDYEKMRTDPEFMRATNRALMIDEHEIVKVLVQIPSGANDFDSSQSYLTIGDETSDFGKPVEIKHYDEMSPKQRAMVKEASQNPSKANQRGGGKNA